jgi:UDP-N-acetylglucosamine--dolichyl-phosphate N-acetylglucosaminephosphotransferase
MSVTTTTSLSRTEILTLSLISGASCAVLANTLHGDGEPLIASLALSFLGWDLPLCAPVSVVAI